MSRHLFINIFEFGGVWYCAEAIVKAEEEVRLSVCPEPHPDIEDAVELFLDEWLGEVVDCHSKLILQKYPGS